MCIDFVYDGELNLDLDILKGIFVLLKKDSLFAENAECCVKFTDDMTIKGLNQTYRGKDAVTDVLTFDCEMKEVPFIGDIVINLEQADRQKGDSPLMIEIIRLFLHALLHLAGMDHLTKVDKEKMTIYENKYNDFLTKE